MESEKVYWLDGDRKRLDEAEVWVQLVSYLDKNPTANVSVGTDSNPYQKGFRFITSVCAHTPTKGGIFFMKCQFYPKERFHNNSKAKLFEEVTQSLDVAYGLQNMLIEPEVHVDAGDPVKTESFSSEFGDQLKGYVVGSGFKCKLKPDSFAASSVSDKFTRS